MESISGIANVKLASGNIRRSHPSTLAEVVREVDAMVSEKVRGPVSLLVGRLAARGITVAESTLRGGDCRQHLERVWTRRAKSVRSFGPTGGHDLRPVVELVDHVLDLQAMIARVEADLKGVIVEKLAVERDPRSRAVCAKKAIEVAARAALIPGVIKKLAGEGIRPSFKTVAVRLTEAGHPITHRSVRRNEAYWRPILEFELRAPPLKPHETNRAALMKKSSEELGATVHRLLAEHRALCARFEETLG